MPELSTLGATIKTAYEGEANTNAFTDTEQTKLSGIEAGAQVNTVDSVHGRTGDVVASSGDYSSDLITYNNTTSGLTATDVKAAIDELANRNEFTDAEQTKLSGIEAGAQVNTVDSVHGRTGDIAASSGDYSSDLITYDNTTSGLTATDVKAAIDELANAPSAPSSLSGLTDVTITSVADNDIIAYDSGSGEYINQTAAEVGLATDTHTHTLSDLTDVDSTVSTPSDGDILVYRSSGSDWVLEAKPSGGTTSELDATPNTDHTASGPTTSTINAGTTVATGELCYIAGDGEWTLANAGAESTAKGVLAIALESGTDGNTLNVGLPGAFIRDDSWTWTVGAVLYISTTNGNITETAPTGSGEIVRIIGYATAANIIYFNPAASWIEVA